MLTALGRNHYETTWFRHLMVSQEIIRRDFYEDRQISGAHAPGPHT